MMEFGGRKRFLARSSMYVTTNSVYGGISPELRINHRLSTLRPLYIRKHVEQVSQKWVHPIITGQSEYGENFQVKEREATPASVKRANWVKQGLRKVCITSPSNSAVKYLDPYTTTTNLMPEQQVLVREEKHYTPKRDGYPDYFKPEPSSPVIDSLRFKKLAKFRNVPQCVKAVPNTGLQTEMAEKYSHPKSYFMQEIEYIT